MKKIITVFTMSALLVSSLAFAQNVDKPKDNFRDCPKGFHQNMNQHKMIQDDLVIGTVKSVNTQDNTITITDADKKDISIKLVKFSIINFIPFFPMPENLDEKTTKPEKPEGKRHPHPSFSIKDIENGNEVAVAVFKTNTKTKVAAFVTVIKQIDKK